MLDNKISDILSQAPYALPVDSIQWVTRKIASLNLREKIGQLINVQVMPGDESVFGWIEKFQIGSVTVINFADREQCRFAIQRIQHSLELPPLVCADVEGGVTSGHITTTFPNQLGCAAAGSPDTYRAAMQVLAAELKELGVNWTFSPVLDVNSAFRSAIVGTRSFGSDPDTIAAFSEVQIQALQSAGVATTAKHWPGEGYDDRDQHLVTTVNPMTVDEWFGVFGRLYRQAIAQGVMSVMSAHIAFPEYARQHGATGLAAYQPASVSRLLNDTLLRGELGFNGLIVSDATLMGGLESWSTRREFVPELVRNGCDMVLFSATVAEDIQAIEDAVQSGALTEARVDEALVRILGLKAKLGLHLKSPVTTSTVTPESTANRSAISRLSVDCPTLIKDVRGSIPLNPAVIKKILVIKEENVNPLGGNEFAIVIDKLLAKEGFDVAVFQADQDDIEECTNFDLIIYALAQESQLTKSRIFLDWNKLHGGTLPSMRRFWHEKPTVLISFGHPYYLYDAPRMPCLINAYTPTLEVQQAVVDKMVGRSEFVGISPVDAFCGLEDARY